MAEPPSERPAPGDPEQLARQRERAAAWVNIKWKHPATCPVCGENTWQIGDVVEMRGFRSGTLDLSAPITPVFPVTCNNCGHAVLFNALITGVIDRPPADRQHAEQPLPADAEKQE